MKFLWQAAAGSVGRGRELHQRGICLSHLLGRELISFQGGRNLMANELNFQSERKSAIGCQPILRIAPSGFRSKRVFLQFEIILPLYSEHPQEFMSFDRGENRCCSIHHLHNKSVCRMNQLVALLRLHGRESHEWCQELFQPMTDAGTNNSNNWKTELQSGCDLSAENFERGRLRTPWSIHLSVFLFFRNMMALLGSNGSRYPWSKSDIEASREGGGDLTTDAVNSKPSEANPSMTMDWHFNTGFSSRTVPEQSLQQNWLLQLMYWPNPYIILAFISGYAPKVHLQLLGIRFAQTCIHYT